MDYPRTSHVPSGHRGGIGDGEVDKEYDRPAHLQHITRDDRISHKFTHTQFVGHLANDMRFGRNGDLTITITVPHEFKHLAEPLSNAFGLPLSVDVQVWAPYSESKE